MLNTLLERKRITASSGGSTATGRLYTVPAGRIAIIHVRAIVKFQGSSTLNVDGRPVTPVGLSEYPNNRESLFFTLFAESHVDLNLALRSSLVLEIFEYASDSRS